MALIGFHKLKFHTHNGENLLIYEKLNLVVDRDFSDKWGQQSPQIFDQLSLRWDLKIQCGRSKWTKNNNYDLSKLGELLQLQVLIIAVFEYSQHFWCGPVQCQIEKF